MIVGVFLAFSYIISSPVEKGIFNPGIYMHSMNVFLCFAFVFLALMFLWQLIINREFNSLVQPVDWFQRVPDLEF